MGTTICDICDGVVSEDDLRGQLKVGTASMDEGRKFDVCIECVHGLTSTCRRLVSSPFRLFLDDNGNVKDTQAPTALQEEK